MADVVAVALVVGVVVVIAVAFLARRPGEPVFAEPGEGAGAEPEPVRVVRFTDGYELDELAAASTHQYEDMLYCYAEKEHHRNPESLIRAVPTRYVDDIVGPGEMNDAG